MGCRRQYRRIPGALRRRRRLRRLRLGFRRRFRCLAAHLIDLEGVLRLVRVRVRVGVRVRVRVRIRVSL